MIKKATAAFLACILFVFSFSSCAKKSVEPYDIDPLIKDVGTSSVVAYVVRRDYKIPVFSRYQTRSVRPGALNHIMVALLVLEKTPDPVNTNVTVTNETFAGIEGAMLPNIDMVTGETYSVEDLLYAMLLGNSYDAANLLAQYVGGDAGITGCIEMMNAKAREVCQTDGTTFVDPNGLTPKNQYTTAYDFYKITDFVLSTQPTFINYFAQQEYTIPKRVNQRAFTVTNYNPLTIAGNPNAYQGATGIAYTRYADDEGQYENLVTLVNIDGVEYISVLLYAPGTGPDASTTAIYNPNPTSSAATSSAVTSSTDSSGDTSSVPETTTPTTTDGTSTIFADTRDIFTWIQQYVRWIPYIDGMKELYTVQMDVSTQYPNMTLPVGLGNSVPVSTASGADASVTSLIILCIGPTNFVDPLKKDEAVGQATIVNMTDGSQTVENIVTLDSTEPSTILQLVLMLLRIIVILAVIFLLLIILIRFRNVKVQQQAMATKRNNARKAAVQGHTVNSSPTSPTRKASTPPKRKPAGTQPKTTQTRTPKTPSPTVKKKTNSNSRSSGANRPTGTKSPSKSPSANRKPTNSTNPSSPKKKK